MLDHLAIQCADVPASAAFYDRVLPAVGGQRLMDFGDVIGYGIAPMPDFWLGSRTTGEGFRESHIAFAAPTREAVRVFFQLAVDAGAEVLHPPRVWPEYHPAYYGAFVRDPDGNNVEVVCHLPEQPVEPSRRVVEELASTTGAIIIGRGAFGTGDDAGGWADTPYDVPHFVGTHRTPQPARATASIPPRAGR